MNRLFHFLSLLLVVITIVGCEPEMSFTEPQPSGKTAKEKFKSKFRGQYLCVEDSSILNITKTKIVQNWHFVLQSEGDSITDIKQITGDFNHNAEEKELVIKVNEDSTQYVIDYTKTIFSISPSSLLKYEKGIYFLNSKKTSHTWNVKIVHFDSDGSLLVRDLSLYKEDLEKLERLTELQVEKDVDGDITAYKLQPTRKELREILKSGLFEEGERFVRIK